MVGGWPLFTRNALNWSPGKIKVVSVDALPAQLAYLKTGTSRCCSPRTATAGATSRSRSCWRRSSNNKEPVIDVRVIDPLTRVTKENVDEFGKKWEKWLEK